MENSGQNQRQGGRGEKKGSQFYKLAHTEVGKSESRVNKMARKISARLTMVLDTMLEKMESSIDIMGEKLSTYY